MKKAKDGELVSEVPTRIPIPEWILQITEPQQRREELKTCWLSYGYSDRYEVVRIESGHFIMSRKR